MIETIANQLVDVRCGAEPTKLPAPWLPPDLAKRPAPVDMGPVLRDRAVYEALLHLGRIHETVSPSGRSHDGSGDAVYPMVGRSAAYVAEFTALGSKGAYLVIVPAGSLSELSSSSTAESRGRRSTVGRRWSS